MQTYNKLKNISETTADSKIAIIAFLIRGFIPGVDNFSEEREVFSDRESLERSLVLRSFFTICFISISRKTLVIQGYFSSCINDILSILCRL